MAAVRGPYTSLERRERTERVRAIAGGRSAGGDASDVFSAQHGRVGVAFQGVVEWYRS